MKKNPHKKPGAQRQGGLPKHLIPGNPGNSGGKKGRSGRKPLPLLDLCKEVVSSSEFQTIVFDAATNPKHQHHKFYATLALEYGYGKPKESVEHSVAERTLEQILAASWKE